MGWLIAILIIGSIVFLCKEFVIGIFGALMDSKVGKTAVCASVVSVGATIIFRHIVDIPIFQTISSVASVIAIILIVVQVIYTIYRQ